MNPYEMTFILRPDLDDDATRAALDAVLGRLRTAGAEIIATFPWNPARRRMAYPIAEFGDGYYVTTTFRIQTDAIREFENALKLNTNVLRFLLVQATEANIAHSQRMQQAAAAAAAAPAPQPQAAAPGSPEPAPAATAGEPPPEVAPAETAAEAAPETAGTVEEAGVAGAAAPEVEEVPEPEPVATAANAAPNEQAEE